MITGVIVALAAGVAIFVLAPLRRSAVLSREDDEERGRRDRDAALLTLRDIELDRATGKLNDGDYADLQARYAARTREALRPPTGPQAPTEGGESV